MKLFFSGAPKASSAVTKVEFSSANGTETLTLEELAKRVGGFAANARVNMERYRAQILRETGVEAEARFITEYQKDAGEFP